MSKGFQFYNLQDQVVSSVCCCDPCAKQIEEEFKGWEKCEFEKCTSLPSLCVHIAAGLSA